MTTDSSGSDLHEVDDPFFHPEQLKYGAEFKQVKERNSQKWTLLKTCDTAMQARNLTSAIRHGKVVIPVGKWDIGSSGTAVWIKYLEPSDEVVVVPVLRGRRKRVLDS
jgi:hypothetical protein